MVATVTVDESGLSKYRPWLYAASIYNLVWGGVNIVLPFLFFDLVGLDRPRDTALWRVVAMFVLVYAPAYWWAARYPARHRHLVAIGLLGKVLGPIGYVWAVTSGRLPTAFGWTILTNDVIWWPAFGLYVRDAARLSGGFVPLLRGE